MAATHVLPELLKAIQPPTTGSFSMLAQLAQSLPPKFSGDIGGNDPMQGIPRARPSRFAFPGIQPTPSEEPRIQLTGGLLIPDVTEKNVHQSVTDQLFSGHSEDDFDGNQAHYLPHEVSQMTPFSRDHSN